MGKSDKNLGSHGHRGKKTNIYVIAFDAYIYCKLSSNFRYSLKMFDMSQNKVTFSLFLLSFIFNRTLILNKGGLQGTCKVLT